MDWKEKGVGWGWKGEGWGWKREGFRQYRRVLKKPDNDRAVMPASVLLHTFFDKYSTRFSQL